MKPIKSVLILALVDPSGNPRPKRIIHLCKEEGLEVHVASFAMNKKVREIDHHYMIHRPSMKMHMRTLRKAAGVLNLLLPLTLFEEFQSNLRYGVTSLRKILRNKDFDLLIVEDLYLLPFAHSVKGQGKVLMDAREFYPGEFNHNFLWNLLEKPVRIRVCKKNLPLCDAAFTVSPGLQDEYKKLFDVSMHLVRSVPYYSNVGPSKCNSDSIRIVHHGNANRDRCLEKMIDIFSNLDSRFELHFYLSGNEQYQNELKVKSQNFSGIIFHEPVPFDEIIPTLNSYDIGLCYFEPTTFNLKHCLPNKLFEFIQARLVIAAGPSPDISNLVHSHQCGVISNSFNAVDMAEKINALSSTDIMNIKQLSDKAARELCFEEEGKKVIRLFHELGISSRPSCA